MKTRWILLLLSAVLFMSCASSKQSVPGYRYSYDNAGGNDVAMGDTTGSFQRMLLYNATIDLKVKNSDTTLARLKAIAAVHKGYTTNLGTSSATIRVKASQLNEAMDDIARLGKVERRNIYSEDVTEQYFDITIRLENANKARARYLELLAKAENVEAALKVEKELERLNGEIDLMQGKINRLKHLEEYSTITVYIHQKKKLGILGYVSVGLYKGVRWLFVRG